METLINSKEVRTKDNLADKCLRTYTERYVDFIDPLSKDIDIRDIARSLSLQCRFASQLKTFYSVAEHSIWCCKNAPEELKLEALLHDASEAYLLDIPTPLKALLPEYKKIEAQFTKVIEHKFRLNMTKENKKIVKSIDIKAFAWENKNLVDCKAYSAITYLEPRQAEILFLGLYNKYKRD